LSRTLHALVLAVLALSLLVPAVAVAGDQYVGSLTDERLWYTRSFGETGPDGELDFGGSANGSFDCADGSFYANVDGNTAHGPYPAPYSTSVNARFSDGLLEYFRAYFYLQAGDTEISGSAKYTGSGADVGCGVTHAEGEPDLYQLEIGSGGGANRQPVTLAYDATIAGPDGVVREHGEMSAAINLACYGSSADIAPCEVVTILLTVTAAFPPPTGYMFGTVTAAGAPAAGATIVVVTDDEDREMVAYVQTGVDGYYQTDPIVPGTYLFDVYPPDQSGDTYVFETSGQLTIGDEPLNEDFTLDTAPMTTVSGKLKLTDGTAVAGTGIAICWGPYSCRAPTPETAGGGPSIRTTYTAADGSYTFRNVPAVDVDFAVWDPDYGDSFVVADLVLDSPSDQVDLVLQRGPASIEGNLTFSDGDPVASGRIRWSYCDTTGEYGPVRWTTSSGAFAIRGLHAAPGCVVIRGLDENAEQTAEVEVNYTSNVTTGVQLALSPIPGSKLRIEVADTRGTPVSGAYAYAESDLGQYFEAVTNEQGVAIFRGIEPGSVLTGQVSSNSPGGTFRRQLFQASVGTTTVILPITLAALAEDTDGSTQLGGTPTEANPVSAEISNPAGGRVSIVEAPTPDPIEGYRFLGSQLTIQARSSTPENPIRLTFTIDSSLLGGVAPQDVVVTRDGETAGTCTSTDVVANPDPCVYSRVVDGSGDVTMVVLTSHASAWLLAAPEAASVSADAAIAAVQALPASALKAPGNRAALTSRLTDVNAAITAGDTKAATKQLTNLRKQVNGCGTKADKDDWIVDCSAQTAIRSLLDELLADLSS
jgi:hypothetical protein